MHYILCDLHMLQDVGEHVERIQLRRPEIDGALSNLEIFELSPEYNKLMIFRGAANQGWELHTETVPCPVSHAPDPVPHYFSSQETLEAHKCNKGA